MAVDISKVNKRNHILFYVYYFVIFFGGAVQGSFFGMYLNNRGMSAANVGLMNGIIQVLGLVLFPLWGKLADRVSNKNIILIGTQIACIIVLFGFFLTENVLMIAIVNVLFSLVHNPVMYLYESITMQHVKTNGWIYSPIRMSGTIGYAVMAVVAGFFLGQNDNLIFPIYIGSMAISTIVALMLPKTPRMGNQVVEKKVKGEKVAKGESVYSLLKNKRILGVLFLSGIYTMSTGFNMSYYGIHMTELGGDYIYVGIANMIMAFAECPFHVGPGRKWLKKIGVEKAMLIVMAFGTVRWVLAGLCNNPWIFVWTMAFNGIMLVPNTVGVTEFIYDQAPDHLKVSAQTSLKSPFAIAGQLFANFVLGRLLVGLFDNAGLPGIRIVYVCMAPICLISGLIVGIPILIREKAEKAARAAAQQVHVEE